MKNVLEFQVAKSEGRPISMVTVYDFTSAKILNATKVDCLLVGDSLAMTMHGFSSTVSADVALMVPHVAAAARGAQGKFIVADLPFMSFRKGIGPAVEAVEVLMRAGAHAVKLEGLDGHEDVIEHIVKSGVPVMGHLGLTPQSVNSLGGMRVQARSNEQGKLLMENALKLQSFGCFSIVLECIPAKLAEQVSREIRIPTIGIGAGVGCDGQVLVFQDLLGLNPDFKPKFLKTYLDGFSQIQNALNTYHEEVVSRKFPGPELTYDN